MSTSPRVGRMRFPAGFGAAREPLTAHRARGIYANNALHFADTKCNHWVNWVAPKAAAVGGNVLVRIPNPITTTWSRVAVFGPFPMTLRADGTPYPVRMELLGATASGGTAVEFGCALVAEVAHGADLIEDAGSRIDGFGVVYSSTSSATPAWLTAAQGAVFFTPSTSLVGRGRKLRSTLVDTGGAPANVETTEVYVVAWGKSASAIVAPRIYGMHVSEYVGT
jgi:hypothetical protein